MGAPVVDAVEESDGAGEGTGIGAANPKLGAPVGGATIACDIWSWEVPGSAGAVPALSPAIKTPAVGSGEMRPLSSAWIWNSILDLHKCCVCRFRKALRYSTKSLGESS